MATTKNIDTVLPPFLEHKVNARKATKLVGTKLFAQYANSGHIVIADLLSKKQKTIKFGDTLNIRQFDVSKHATHLAVVYGENVDDSTLAVCDLETDTIATMSCTDIFDRFLEKMKREGPPASPFSPIPSIAKNVNLLLCSKSHLVFVTSDSIYRVKYISFKVSRVKKMKQLKPEPTPNTPRQNFQIAVNTVPKLCRSSHHRVLLVGSREVQLWDFRLGKPIINASLGDPNAITRFGTKTYMLVDWKGSCVVATTSDSLYIHCVDNQSAYQSIPPHKPRSILSNVVDFNPDTIVVPTPVCTSSCYIGPNSIYLGNLDGLIAEYAIADGKFLGNINKVVHDPKVKRGLMTQLRSRVTHLELQQEEFLLSAFEEGELAVWRLGEKYNQVDPLRDVELKPGATVSGMSWTVAADKVVGVIVRRQQRTEEVYSWDIKMKKNLKKAATDSPRKGYSPND